MHRISGSLSTSKTRLGEIHGLPYGLLTPITLSVHKKTLPVNTATERANNGVDDGARSRDFQSHSLVLYQLSYVHHRFQEEVPSPHEIP